MVWYQLNYKKDITCFVSDTRSREQLIAYLNQKSSQANEIRVNYGKYRADLAYTVKTDLQSEGGAERILLTVKVNLKKLLVLHLIILLLVSSSLLMLDSFFIILPLIFLLIIAYLILVETTRKETLKMVEKWLE